MLQPPRLPREAGLKLVTCVTLPSRARFPGLLIWVMVLLPPLLVLRRVGGARSPSVSSGGGEGRPSGSEVGAIASRLMAPLVSSAPSGDTLSPGHGTCPVCRAGRP